MAVSKELEEQWLQQCNEELEEYRKLQAEIQRIEKEYVQSLQKISAINQATSGAKEKFEDVFRDFENLTVNCEEKLQVTPDVNGEIGECINYINTMKHVVTNVRQRYAELEFLEAENNKKISKFEERMRENRIADAIWEVRLQGVMKSLEEADAEERALLEQLDALNENDKKSGKTKKK